MYMRVREMFVFISVLFFFIFFFNIAIESICNLYRFGFLCKIYRLLPAADAVIAVDDDDNEKPRLPPLLVMSINNTLVVNDLHVGVTARCINWHIIATCNELKRKNTTTTICQLFAKMQVCVLNNSSSAVCRIKHSYDLYFFPYSLLLFFAQNIIIINCFFLFQWSGKRELRMYECSTLVFCTVNANR